MKILSKGNKNKRSKIALIVLAFIFLLVFGTRLFFAFDSDNLSIDGAYFSHRQVESIKETGFPSFVDDLSFSGRTHIFPSLFYYLLTGASFLFGTVFALKIIPNFLASLLVVIVYFIVIETTNDKKSALLSAFAVGFVPAFFAGTLISAASISFTLPLIFFCLYCFMRISERKFLHYFLFVSFVLALSSAASFIFIFALLIYLLFFKLEFKKRNRVETESILFVTFLTLWINALIYKKAFLFHSYELIWRNLPSQVLINYFRDIDMVASVTGIGLFTLVCGVYAVYKHMFSERDKRTYLLMAFAISVASLLWFKLLTIEIGLMFLGVTLVPLFGQALHSAFLYIDKTRAPSLNSLFLVLCIVLIILTSIIPSFAHSATHISNSVTSEELDALYWISNNTPKDSTVLSSIDEGTLISAIARRKNVADTDFILIRNSDMIFDDVESMYTSFFKTNALELMTRYGVDYIYVSKRNLDYFGIDYLNYVEPDCFRLVYDNEISVNSDTLEKSNDSVRIYEVLCHTGIKGESGKGKSDRGVVNV